MSDYLLKTEASAYSFADLQRDKVTVWDGVTNPAAVKHLREMTPRCEIGHIRDGRSEECGRYSLSDFRRCHRSQKSGGEDQSRESACAAGFSAADQGQPALRRFASGASG